ncbi:response regulator [Flagellimonas lutaonensis]|uniref:Transcriptional regulator n=1 Tax=Flagellimonas lutaonensis TaxID=516051 RepID=A0A0D5YPS0_9FLAO|nr:response regulator [Allomuricauda lutaonensis]AKA34222.1 transcriptional regulator [Allomuricauda lutaonensis]
MKKILIIEDNTDVRENMADILELANYSIATAEDGEIGVAKARELHPDLIVCDIMMPKLDGYGVLEELNRHEDTAGTPFIFLTAKSEKTEVRKGMNLGADDYLTKPFEEHELLQAIECRIQKREFLRKQVRKDIEGIHRFLEDASDYLNIENISKTYHQKNYEKKEFLFMEGDAAHTLFFVQSGVVKTYKSTESGKELVTGLHKAGDFIGQLSLLSPDGKYLETATILEDAEIFGIPKQQFTQLIYGNKEVAQKFIGLISNNLIAVQEQLVDMAYASVRKRVAKALLTMQNKGIIKNGSDEGLDIPREDFAGMVGTATETAIRTLTDFREEGLIAMGKARRIILLNKEGLRHIADFG